MNVVWYRLRVSESQRHTPIKIFPSTPPGHTSQPMKDIMKLLVCDNNRNVPIVYINSLQCSGKGAKILWSVAAFLCKAEWIDETTPKWMCKNHLLKKSSNYVLQVWCFLKNCYIHHPQQIEAVWFHHCSCKSWKEHKSRLKYSGSRLRGRGQNVVKQQWMKQMGKWFNLFCIASYFI